MCVFLCCIYIFLFTFKTEIYELFYQTSLFVLTRILSSKWKVISHHMAIHGSGVSLTSLHLDLLTYLVLHSILVIFNRCFFYCICASHAWRTYLDDLQMIMFWKWFFPFLHLTACIKRFDVFKRDNDKYFQYFLYWIFSAH